MTNTVTDTKLNASQLKFYDDYVNNPDEAVGNLAWLYKLSKSVDAQRLADAISAAVNNHKAFSLRFYKDEKGEPRQHILPDVRYQQRVECMTDEAFEALKESLIEKYSFFDAPLFNSRVIETQTSLYWFIDTHHTISDSNAVLLLLDDINHAYNGEPLEPECWSPCDVAEYEYNFAESRECRESIELLKASWKDCCGCFPPSDINEEAYSKYKYFVPLDINLTNMAEFTKRVGCPLSVLSAAACSLLLAHETGERNAALVTAFNCRNRPEIEHTMSMVTRYLLFNVPWNESMSVTDFLASAQYNGQLGRDNVYANLMAMKELGKDFSNFMPFVFQGNMMNKITHPVLCGEPSCTIPFNQKGGYIKPFNIHFIFSNGTANLMFICHKNKYSVEYINKFAKKYEAILNRIQTASTVGELLQ